nr:MAG TPA: hypothetical protein [Caudoviricetes sp.]
MITKASAIWRVCRNYLTNNDCRTYDCVIEYKIELLHTVFQTVDSSGR